MRLLVFILSAFSSCYVGAQVTTTSTVFDSSILTNLLIADKYGRSNNPQNFRRCRRLNGRKVCHKVPDQTLPLLYLASFKTVTKTTGCFPDSATLERQLPSGEFETIPMTDLQLGDMVKCLRAPLGPKTSHPEVGVCKYVSESHNLPNTITYTQIFYEEQGQPKMIALTPSHLMWSSSDALEGTVNAETLNITNEMFVEARQVRVGHTIAVKGEKNNTLVYHQVKRTELARMPGLHNPQFLDGGLPFVDGVLGTSSAFSTEFGGHWPLYFKFAWFEDNNYEKLKEARQQLISNKWALGEFSGKVTVDNQCFLDRILNALQANVDVTAYRDYTSFAEVYVKPCSNITDDFQFDVSTTLSEALADLATKEEAFAIELKHAQLLESSRFGY